MTGREPSWILDEEKQCLLDRDAGYLYSFDAFGFPSLLPLDLLNRSGVNMSSVLNMSFNSPKKTFAIYMQGGSLSENLYLHPDKHTLEVSP